MTLAANAPKSKHYSKSESLDYRDAAAGCQKNGGEGCLSPIYSDIGLSPGRVAELSAGPINRSKGGSPSVQTKFQALWARADAIKLCSSSSEGAS